MTPTKRDELSKRWNDLTPGQRVAIVVAALSDAILKGVALRDLRRRPAEEIRGPKWVWSLVILVNSAGLTSLSYLAFGRRQH